MNGFTVLMAALILIIFRICLLLWLYIGKSHFPSQTTDFASFVAQFKFIGLNELNQTKDLETTKNSIAFTCFSKFDSTSCA